MPRAILERVEALIRRGWTSSVPARDSGGRRVEAKAIDAVSWSLFGALAAVSRPMSDEWQDAVKTLVVAAQCSMPQCSTPVDLLDWSEAAARTQEEVLAVVELALKR